MFKIASFLLAIIVFFISPAPAVLASSWTNDVLVSHNAARAQYGAKPLAWNANLYAGTLQWAGQCKSVHSNSRQVRSSTMYLSFLLLYVMIASNLIFNMVVHRYKYGENLYYDTRNVGIKEAVNYWMSEAPKYDYKKPGFSQATGKGEWYCTTRQFSCSSWTGPIGFVILKQVYKTQ